MRGASRAAAPSRAPASDADTAVAEAVRGGLLRARKRLPAWLLYDARGSALFEEITRLPEYYLTRTERALLAEHAGAIVDAARGPAAIDAARGPAAIDAARGPAAIDAARGPLEIVELGAGSAVKTRLVLEALLARQRRVRYVPVDVSASALAQARVELRGLRGLAFEPVVARYPEELGFLRAPAQGPREVADRRLVLFLGSNIGNYDERAAVELLAAVRRHLAPGDALLVGADRRKSPALLRPAYDDAAGVTAGFNRNVLTRLNRELGATFDLRLFAHVVRWNARASRVELYLESRAAHRVTIAALGARVDLAAGERIHTESSYKLTDARLRGLLARAGLVPEATWRDERRWFGLTLARVPAR